jgi:hypothetical protein
MSKSKVSIYLKQHFDLVKNCDYYEITKLVNTTRFSIGGVLTKNQVNDIIREGTVVTICK